jgi:sec-independent protein translocase protein TatA
MLVWHQETGQYVAGDIGKATVKGFKDGVKGEDDAPAANTLLLRHRGRQKSTIDVETKEKSKF